MSWDTQKNYFYKRHGKVLRLYKLRKNSHRAIDSEGRVPPSSNDDLIYPDETITDGLRVEYTALVKPFVQQDPEATAYTSLTEVTSPTELSHISLNRVLSLAVVEYLKAMFAERKGDLQSKEYFMREFYNKLADNESNRNNVFVATPMSPFAVK